MADRKPTVLNPAGYQENLQDTDNLVVEAAPIADNHAVNKEFVDDLKVEIDGDIADAGKWEEGSGKLYPKDLTNNVQVGGTAAAPNISLNASGSASFTDRSSITIPADGTALDIKKDIVFVGSLGTDGNDFSIGAIPNSTGGIKFTTKTTSTTYDRVLINNGGDVFIGGTLPSASNISLNADGSASFRGSRVELTGTAWDRSNNTNQAMVDNGTVYAKRVSSNASAPLFRGHFGTNPGDDSDKTVEIIADGSATFAGSVDVGSFESTGDIITNANVLIKGADSNGLFIRNGADNAWNVQLKGDGSANFIGNVTAASFTGPVTGNITGNADTATKLKTARNINGTAFDGTSAITTAKWGTARNLNGVSVDGSANKTLDPKVDRDDNSNAQRYLTFVDDSVAGYKRLNMDTDLSYNPSTNTLNVNINGNSGNLDGLDSTQFLRSDVSDTFSGSDLTIQGRLSIRGNMDLSDGENLDFGSSDDVRINYNGTTNYLYCNHRTSNGLVFQDNGTDKMVLEDSGVFRPTTTNTGTIGSTSHYWQNGYFQNFNVASVLNVRGAIDLADNDILRLGSGDDAELFCNGSHLYLDLNSGIGNFYIRDGTTNRFTFDDNGAFTCTGKLTAGNFDLESLPSLP